MKVQQIIIDFFFFIKKPQVVVVKKAKLNEILLMFFTIMFLMFFTVFFSALSTKIIVYIIDFDEGMKIFNYQKSKLNKYSIWENISYILFIGPIIEELISRLYLNLKKSSLITALICITLVFLKKTNLIFDTNDFIFLILIGLVLTIILKMSQKLIFAYGIKYFSLIFYFSSVIFSTLHFSNYTTVISNNYLWLLPLLVFPQFIMGIFFGYIRIKLGFFWGILLHILMNLPAVLIYVMTKLYEFRII